MPPTWIAGSYESREYAAAVREVMALADRANLYIDRHKPWLAAKDPARAAEVQAICTQGLNLFRVLMTCLKPVMPVMAEQAEDFLGAPVATLARHRRAAARRRPSRNIDRLRRASIRRWYTSWWRRR